MVASFDALLDFVSQQRRAAHLRAARTFEQNSEFHRRVEELFASLGLDTEARRARLAADVARRQAERERNHVERLVEDSGDWLAAS
jgi:hypothetical protein